MPDSPAQAAALLARAPEAPEVLNALTVDVEDYFHVAAFEGCLDRSQWPGMESRVTVGTHKILDALARVNARGTFFVLGWVAEHYPEVVREIQAAGHEIGCHSYWHRLVYQQTPDEFREDLRRARDVLEDIIARPVVSYRAPCFSITNRSLWALDILIEEGFTHDSSVFPTFHDRYGIADAPLTPHWIDRPSGRIAEFPLTVYRCLGYPLPIGGGGYLRLYPYALTRHGLRVANAQARPAAIYLHPWELDPDQPRLSPGRLNAFRHYVNIRWTETRLRRLLDDFRVGTLTEAFAQASTQPAPTAWAIRQAA